MRGATETYQFRNYPRHVAERAWQRIAGSREWISLDRFAAILSAAGTDQGRDMATAAVSSKAFLGKSGRRLALFLPKPSRYERRCDAWRVTAKILQRFAADPDLGPWYLESIWLLAAAAKSWCAKKGYKFELPNANQTPIAPNGLERQRPASRQSSPPTPKQLRGKPGPKPKYNWERIKAEIFAEMDKRDDFNPEAGWIRAALVRLILDKFSENDQGQKQIDERSLDRRLNNWLDEWRTSPAARPPLKQIV